jgi:hypothetical protein
VPARGLERRPPENFEYHDTRAPSARGACERLPQLPCPGLGASLGRVGTARAAFRPSRRPDASGSPLAACPGATRAPAKVAPAWPAPTARGPAPRPPGRPWLRREVIWPGAPPWIAE